MRIDVDVLNIGKLGAGAGEYYVGEVASSAEDYYAGHGESAGRWVGSLAPQLGLEGAVDPEHFRRVLAGRHPHTEQLLVRHGGSRERNGLDDESMELGTVRAASYLGVSAQYVRRLLAEGDRYQQRVDGATDRDVVPEPSAYLRGVRSEGNGQVGSDAWTIALDELDRFVATRRQARFRPGYDLTLRPPKSVSVLWALADEPRRGAIRDAHAEAVDEVVRYYEDRAVFARAGGGDRRLIGSDGIVAAAFDHRTSRAGDPLLHTHVVTANMTRVETRDGPVWRAIPGAGLFEHARTAGHLYQAQLRHLLATRLGITFGPAVNGTAEATGVPAELVRHFSRRRQEIEQAMAEAGTSSARAAQVATLNTRHAKDYGVEPDQLRDRWHGEAIELGITPETIADCFDHDLPARRGDRDGQFEIMAGPFGLTEMCATFARTDVIQAIANSSNATVDSATVEQIADEFLASPYVQLVDRAGSVDLPPLRVAGGSTRRSVTQRMYTTPDIARLESRLMASASLASTAAPIPKTLLANVVAERPELSDEQRTMIGIACSSTQFVLPVAGRPGAGKTFATEAIVAAYVGAGVPIVGCAVSANAAAELEHAASFARSTRMPATTVARLLLDVDEHGLAPGTVIVVDEASMLGTRALARLADHARHVDGRVILVGDPDQHGAVDVGGVYVRLCREAGEDLTCLVENNRQQNMDDRLAIDDYREGHVADALARYDDNQRIVRSATAGESFDAMVADWYTQHVTDGRADPMIAGPNSTRRALNERARHLLKTNGELHGEPMNIGGREFMVGDLVVARRNDRSLRGTREGFVRNGSAGRVTGLDVDRRVVTVDFDREGIVRLPERYLTAGHLDHGYARTTYGVQGATHQTGRYHPTDMSGFEEGYVALTRARHETRVYVVDGTTSHANDLDHAPAETDHHGLTEITTALERRTSRATVTELAPGIDDVAALAASTSLAALTRERKYLAEILADAPPDPTCELAELDEKIDSLRSRQRAWTELADKHDPNHGDAGQIDATLAEHAATRAALVVERRVRDDWNTRHAPTIERHTLTRRAEDSVAQQVRVAALADPTDPVRRLLGDPPQAQAARRVWRVAVGDAAVYRARYETEPSAGTDSFGEAVVGPRPSRGNQRREWERVAATVNRAIIEPERVPQEAGIEP